jgi:hypothetical protein
MKKISRYFAFIIFCAIGASITFFIHADIFDDLFKNVDFEQLAKDMEKSLGNSEDNKDLPEMSPIPATVPQGLTEKTVEQETTGIQKDRRTLFLDPDMRTIQGKNPQDKSKSVTEPTKESRAAFSSFKQEMENSLKIFEKNIEANDVLSPEFKEKYLYKIREKTDEIVIASEFIDSKKIYQKIFLTPPASSSSQKASTASKWGEFSNKSLLTSPLLSTSPLSDSMKQLRQRYLALIDELNSLNKKIEITEEEESKEEDIIILKELAGSGIIEKEEDLPTYTPLVPSIPKIRGAKARGAKAQPAKQTKSAKQIKTTKKTKPAKSTKHKKAADTQPQVSFEDFLKQLESESPTLESPTIESQPQETQTRESLYQSSIKKSKRLEQEIIDL